MLLLPFVGFSLAMSFEQPAGIAMGTRWRMGSSLLHAGSLLQGVGGGKS
jgi:hypothetical protein